MHRSNGNNEQGGEYSEDAHCGRQVTFAIRAKLWRGVPVPKNERVAFIVPEDAFGASQCGNWPLSESSKFPSGTQHGIQSMGP